MPAETLCLPTPRRLLIALAAALALIGFGRVRLNAPSPRGPKTPATEFSAARARGVLERLLAEEVPHPVGSAANRRVRERVEAELREIGVEPVLQEAAAPSRFFGIVGRVQNVIARLPGQQDGPAILLACHYDSVPAGPGASDDGVGVAAVLEVVRALKAGPPLRRPVIVLIDDGEEIGLLGAKAFVQHPWWPEVAAVVNLEARGTSGPSLMFQTSGSELYEGSPDESRILPLLASDRSPVFSTSLYTTVYELLPNDTDMSVFIAEGRSGLNFAFIGDSPRYHTPLDDLAHAEDASLQHHGDHALSAVRALADGDWDQEPPGEKQVYTDVWGLTLVAWPRSWATATTVLTALLLLAPIVLLVRTGRLRLRQLAWGLLVIVLSLVLATLAGPLVAWVLRLRGAHPWTGHPDPALTAFRSLALAFGALPVAILGRRASGWGLWAACWLLFAGLGLLANRLPGLTYLCLLPAGAAALGGLAAALRPREQLVWTWLAWGVPGAVAAALWTPLAIGLVAVGMFVEVVAALSAGLLLLPLTPFLAIEGRVRWACPAVPAAIALLATLTSLALPTHTAERPRPLNLTFHQDVDTGAARWLVGAASGPVPPPLEAALPELNAEVEGAFPWTSRRFDARVAPAEPIEVEGPEFELLEQTTLANGRRLRARIRSPRGARVIRLLLAPGAELHGIRLDGVEVPPNTVSARGYLHDWSHYAMVGVPPEGVEIELDLPAGPVDAVLLDMSEGLPPSGDALLEARPDHTVPRQVGDTTIVTRALKL